MRKKPVRRAARRSGSRRGKSGHGCLFFLFFIAVLAAAAMVLGGPSSPVSTGSADSGEKTAAGRILDTVKATGKAVEEAVETPIQKAVSNSEGQAEPSAAGKDAPEESSAPGKGETAVPSGRSSAGDGSKAAPAQPSVRGRLAVVIDDAGRDLASQRVYEQMGIPLTLAVMPNQVHTAEAASEWAAAGLPVIIHQPMESVSGSGMEPVVLLTSMSDTAKRKLLSDSFRQIPQAAGMNNHQGSKATTDRATMDVVMNELAHRGMFFLDSATNTTTAADSAAAAYGVRYARNELFVDNSTDVETIKSMIRKGARMAAANGSAIIIGHCRPHTAEAFRQAVPELRAEGIRFIYVSDLLR